MLQGFGGEGNRVPAADRRQQHSADCTYTWEYVEVKDTHTCRESLKKKNQHNVNYTLPHVLQLVTNIFFSLEYF